MERPDIKKIEITAKYALKIYPNMDERIKPVYEALLTLIDYIKEKESSLAEKQGEIIK